VQAIPACSAGLLHLCVSVCVAQWDGVGGMYEAPTILCAQTCVMPSLLSGPLTWKYPSMLLLSV